MTQKTIELIQNECEWVEDTSKRAFLDGATCSINNHNIYKSNGLIRIEDLSDFLKNYLNSFFYKDDEKEEFIRNFIIDITNN